MAGYYEQHYVKSRHKLYCVPRYPKTQTVLCPQISTVLCPQISQISPDITQTVLCPQISNCIMSPDITNCIMSPDINVPRYHQISRYQISDVPRYPPDILVLIFLHTLRVVLTGAYRKPRELNWVVGCLLLGLALFSGYTGYLLPMDLLSLWATQTGMELLVVAPLGEQLRADPRPRRGGTPPVAAPLLRPPRGGAAGDGAAPVAAPLL